jgi:protein-S-isoprenylcysteine O-methyltransferase Ste14
MDNQAKNKGTQQGITRWLVREYMGVVVVALSLFLPAGRWDWGWGWALVAIYLLWTSANTLLLWRRNPDLLVERATRHKDIKSWDTAIMSVVGLLTLAKHTTAGLDVRYSWSVGPAPSLRVILWLVAASGYALGTWAMVSNAYFTTLNRIQTERGHAVADGGPYRYVRHPGYSGVVLFELATPLVLGSWWALIFGVVNAALIVARTALEDRSLKADLPGYTEYAEKTRYRLLPGVW